MSGKRDNRMWVSREQDIWFMLFTFKALNLKKYWFSQRPLRFIKNAKQTQFFWIPVFTGMAGACALQLLEMRNKANLVQGRIDVNIVWTRYYMKLCLFVGSQNKGKQSQFEGETPWVLADGTSATRSKGIAIWWWSGYSKMVMNGISMKGTD